MNLDRSIVYLSGYYLVLSTNKIRLVSERHAMVTTHLVPVILAMGQQNPSDVIFVCV